MPKTELFQRIWLYVLKCLDVIKFNCKFLFRILYSVHLELLVFVDCFKENQFSIKNDNQNYYFDW